MADRRTIRTAPVTARGMKTRWRGPCLACGDRPGRGAGYCATCYHALWRRTRLVRRITGSELSLVGLAVGLNKIDAHDPLAHEALATARQLVDALLNGRAVIHANGGGPYRRPIFSLTRGSASRAPSAPSPPAARGGMSHDG